jgi:hypothetical protein
MHKVQQTNCSQWYIPSSEPFRIQQSKLFLKTIFRNLQKKEVKVKQSHTGPGRPLGLQEVEAPRFLDNRHMEVVRLSALLTDRLYPPGKIPGTHFC